MPLRFASLRFSTDFLHDDDIEVNVHGDEIGRPTV